MALAQRGKGLIGEGGARQVKLEIAHFDAVVVFRGLLRQGQTQLFGQQARSGFQRILGRDEQPHFVRPSALYHKVGQGNVPTMDGVERTTEDGCTHRH